MSRDMSVTDVARQNIEAPTLRAHEIIEVYGIAGQVVKPIERHSTIGSQYSEERPVFHNAPELGAVIEHGRLDEEKHDRSKLLEFVRRVGDSHGLRQRESHLHGGITLQRQDARDDRVNR